MRDLYFAQYLVNTGEITPDELPSLLSRSVEMEPQIAVLAMQDGLLTGKEAAEIAASKRPFAEAAQERNLLTAEQVAALQKSVPDESARLAEALFRQGRHDYERLGELLAAGRSAADPLRDAIARRAEGLLPEEVERYSDFVTIFLRSLIRFMDTPAVISSDAPPLSDGGHNYAVSQRLMGDVVLVTGLLATESMFVEMARRYSHEEISTVDEMAADSLSEFLNVVNGLFIVDMARQNLEIDLGMPRMEENVRPTGNRQLALQVFTSFGVFTLVIAADEFVCKESS
ncbi:MAG: hypothetical protein ACTTJE_07390 [Schwartzia sp. (in: firmicutes)]